MCCGMCSGSRGATAVFRQKCSYVAAIIKGEKTGLVENKEMRAPFRILKIPYRVKPKLQFCALHRADIDQYRFVVGGGEDEEQPLDAAVREISEETSIYIDRVMQLTSIAYVPANVIAERHRQF